MVDKLHEYQGFVGRWHTIRESISGSWSSWREQHPQGIKQVLRGVFDQSRPRCDKSPKHVDEECAADADSDYTHLYRRKTRKELVRVSAAVMGIEFSYAAETAFVSPTLLKIGVTHQHMTLVWALSPLIGFFLTPILGSLSDRCRSGFGRRRPFIAILALGVFLGLILVPNGEDLGYKMGDSFPNATVNETLLAVVLPHRTSAGNIDGDPAWNAEDSQEDLPPNSHPWGVFFTILGTVLLDFDADACQSPARAYLLDVTIPEDHAKGLSTFTIMAGLGGFMGYALGGINWDATLIGVLLGGHVRAVFTFITVIFVLCVSYTITSFREIPLVLLESDQQLYGNLRKASTLAVETENMFSAGGTDVSYGTNDDLEQPPVECMEMQEKSNGYAKIDGADTTEGDVTLEESPPSAPLEEVVSLKEYLRSIVIMPASMRILCLTNLFCWMAHVCYSLYFTDFVGEAVFGGDPQAVKGTGLHELYEEGVRFGCWGMSMYSLSCACYSLIIERLISRFRARRVYVGGLLVYSIGMLLMAVTKHKVGVILFSWSAGVMYSTLFTMPYLLIAHYHASGTFEVDVNGQGKIGTQIRGLGTDIAIVSSMVFLAQFILSMCMGSIVTYSGTTTAVVAVASTLAFLGAISATQVMYLDL